MYENGYGAASYASHVSAPSYRDLQSVTRVSINDLEVRRRRKEKAWTRPPDAGAWGELHGWCLEWLEVAMGASLGTRAHWVELL